MTSAFQPVNNLYLYTFFDGFEEIKPNQIQSSTPIHTTDNKQIIIKSFTSSEIIECSEEKKQSKQVNVTKQIKKRWTFEEKKYALEVVNKMGISKALIYLQQNQSKIYFNLALSTLKYWYKQSVGSKKHLYE